TSQLLPRVAVVGVGEIVLQDFLGGGCDRRVIVRGARRPLREGEQREDRDDVRARARAETHADNANRIRGAKDSSPRYAHRMRRMERAVVLFSAAMLLGLAGC